LAQGGGEASSAVELLSGCDSTDVHEAAMHVVGNCAAAAKGDEGYDELHARFVDGADIQSLAEHALRSESDAVRATAVRPAGPYISSNGLPNLCWMLDWSFLAIARSDRWSSKARGACTGCGWRYWY
jgi:hypothetical protein